MNDKYIFTRSGQLLDNGSLSCEETLFHSANGYIGIRGAFEEGYPDGYTTVRGSYINGVYNNIPMPQAEPLFGLVTEKQTIVNVADVQNIKIYVDGELCTPFTGTLAESERTLDMRNGVVRRIFRWISPKGKTVDVAFTRMASFVRLPLFLLTCGISSDSSCEVEIVTVHSADVMNFSDPNDPRVGNGRERHVIPDKTEIKEEKGGVRSSILSHISDSRIAVGTNLFDKLEGKILSTSVKCGEGTAEAKYSLRLEKDGRICFTRYAVFTDSLRLNDVMAEGGRILEEAVKSGTGVLFEEQKQYLEKFRDNLDFEIEGDDALSSALAFNTYQLLQSIGKDSFAHLGAKGLSGEGYEGHYFWDTEMYVQPTFTLTNPGLSRRLLSYRYSTMGLARENARLLGHKKGILYPWRTISGKECSGYFPSGTAQYHIDGAVAYSVTTYYLVTGDDEFMASEGLEMLVEISRLWCDLGNYHNGKFNLNCVTGPDEYTCIVNNNFYTNCCAKFDLYWTWKLLKAFSEKGLAGKVVKATGVTDDEAEEFLKASENMLLPYDKTLNINPQDDSFLAKKRWDLSATPKEKFPLLLHYHPLTLYRYQVCKQADAVLAHFLYEDYSDPSAIKSSFDYYEGITTHDSSLSKCIFSIVASKLGYAQKAYDYFRDSVEIDIRNSQGNTKDGIHTANMGGSCLAIIFGFAGLRIKENGFMFSPSIPDKWQSYSFRLKLKGHNLKIAVSHKSVGIISADDCENLDIYLYGKKITLKGGICVTESLHI